MKKAQNFVVRELITNKLFKIFSPIHLEVVNESHKHKVPEGSESHFKIKIVSKAFDNLSLVDRHRLIYSCLDDEIKAGVHALALDCRSEEQWKENKGVNLPNIPCKGKGDFLKDPKN